MRRICEKVVIFAFGNIGSVQTVIMSRPDVYRSKENIERRTMTNGVEILVSPHSL